MSDHEFEKQVRQKLDDLRLKPSAESWEKIEDRVRKVGHRPATVYWMPLLLLMLGAGGYFYFNTENGRRQTADVKRELAKNNKTLPHETLAPAVVERKDNEKSSTQKSISQKSHSQKNNYPSRREDVVIEKTKIRLRQTSANISQIKTQNLSPKNTLKSNPSLTNRPGLSTKNLSNSYGNDFSLSYFSKFQQPTVASLKKPLSKELFDMDNQVNLGPPINLKQRNISKKWAIGVRASAGVSAVNEGKFIDISRATVEDVAYRAFAPNVAYAPRPQYTPSRLTPGFSFSAGVTFQRQLSRRISLNTGLNYLRLNTENKVGAKVYGNQVVNNGTRGYLNVYNYYMLEEDRPTDYMNRYHYLELPVSISIGLNRSRKLPVFLDAGISYARLLGSNSLHFDGTTGVYYKNDRLLNDNQFAFTTGFNFKLFNRTKYPLLIGPSARYNVTRMLQKDVPGHKTFMTLGLDMKLFIW
jgi:hypothetical protein